MIFQTLNHVVNNNVRESLFNLTPYLSVTIVSSEIVLVICNYYFNTGCYDMSSHTGIL